MSLPALIYADPPWRFETYGPTGKEKAPDAHYTCMTLTDIKALKPAAASNAVLAMWAYDPMLPEALALGEAWGFRYVTVGLRWLKTTSDLDLFNYASRPMGLGYYTRGASEELLLFKRGKGLPVRDKGVRKELFAKRREHSRKPDEVRDILVRLFGDVPRLEMFARSAAPGWQSHGNEADKFTGAHT